MQILNMPRSTMHQSIRKPKLSYYAHQILQTLLHMNLKSIWSNSRPIFHNLKISEASQLFFSQSWPKTVLKIEFLVFNINLSQTASKALSLPWHSADRGLSEYLYKSLGDFGDKYELTIFFFCKITFFSSIAIFRRKGCENLEKCKQIKSKHWNFWKYQKKVTWN